MSYKKLERDRQVTPGKNDSKTNSRRIYNKQLQQYCMNLIAPFRYSIKWIAFVSVSELILYIIHLNAIFLNWKDRIKICRSIHYLKSLFNVIEYFKVMDMYIEICCKCNEFYCVVVVKWHVPISSLTSSILEWFYSRKTGNTKEG